MIKVFIIDDHEMIIQGIKSLLEDDTEIRWTGSAKTPADLWRHLKSNKPDILLMDINLPETNGIELCSKLSELYPDIRVIGLSSSDQPSIIKKMMKNGAKAYLLKDASKHELITAIKKVMKGEAYVNYTVSEILKHNKPERSLPVLTRREKEVLELIADGLTNTEIAEKLFLNVTTIDSHRKNMITKFDVKNTAALIKLAVSEKLI